MQSTVALEYRVHVKKTRKYENLASGNRGLTEDGGKWAQCDSENWLSEDGRASETDHRQRERGDGRHENGIAA